MNIRRIAVPSSPALSRFKNFIVWTLTAFLPLNGVASGGLLFRGGTSLRGAGRPFVAEGAGEARPIRPWLSPMVSTAKSEIVGVLADRIGRGSVPGGVTHHAGIGSIGADWTQLSPAAQPGVTLLGRMVYDAAIGKLVQFGGATSAGAIRGDTWTFDGTTWTKLTTAHTPSPRYNHSMEYDAAHGKIVLYGGSAPDTTKLSDMWTFDGTDWTLESPMHSPGASAAAVTAYDQANGVIVLFGGTDGQADLDRTWTWDGSDWTEKLPAHKPDVRENAMMAYDSTHGSTILYGGFNGGGGYKSGTWRWNGSDWTEVTGATAPGIRGRGQMSDVPTLGGLLMFSGFGSGLPQDTWFWDGSSWTQLTPATSAAARADASMAYFPALGAAVIFGGWNGNTSFYTDTWTFGPTDGPRVTALSPTSGNIAGGTVVSITGTSLSGATSVKFGDSAATFTVNSATSITVTTPAHTSGTVDVTVTTPTGGTSPTSSSDQFTYNTVTPSPTITSITPAVGTTSGSTAVSITGINISSATSVTFGGAAATLSGATANSITVLTPAHAAGQVDVKVTTPSGSVTRTNGYTYVVPPKVSRVTPTFGTTGGGYRITIMASDFDSTSTVYVGANQATGLIFSPTTISAIVPAGTGIVDVRISNGGVLSDTSSGDLFTYIDPAGPSSATGSAPMVTGIYPAGGSIAGGNTITVRGSNFASTQGVKFGTVAATAFTVVDKNTLTATVPAGTAEGPVSVSVTSPQGTSAPGTASFYTYANTAFVVNKATDNGSGVAANCNAGNANTCQMRDAFAAANALYSGTYVVISFAPSAFPSGTLTTISLASSLPALSGQNLVLAGPGSSQVALSGHNAVTVLYAGSQVVPTERDVISGIALVHGRNTATNSGCLAYYGTGTLLINSVLFDSCVSTTGNGGGAMYTSSGFTYVDGSTFMNNSAGFGSNGFGGGIMGNNGLTINNSTFTGNLTYGTGGAIFINSSNLSVYNTSFSGNTGGSGGAIGANGAVSKIANNTFVNNVSQSIGGAISLGTSGVATITHNTFSGNSAAVRGGALASMASNTIEKNLFNANVSPLSNLNDCDVICDATLNVVGSSAVSALGNYGGTVQTVLPLPGTPALGFVANCTAGQDARGVARPATNCDAGAVQTAFSASFSTQPPATTPVATDFSAAVTVTENGIAYAGLTLPLGLDITTGGLTLANNSATTNASGVASYSTLQINGPATGEKLTLSLGSTVVKSSTFDVTSTVPTLASLTPTSGTTAGGTTVTISGTNLTGATSVIFGGTAATLGANTGTSLVVTSPAHAAGPVDVVVTTAAGSATLTGSFTYTAPAATHFSVSAPSTATAGTAVSITATALDAGNGTVTGYAGTVHFTSSDAAATLPANATLTNGTGSFNVTLATPGTQTVTVTDTVTSGITGTTSSITVSGTTPTIAFNIADKTFGDADFTVAATSNSGGAITYSVQSGPATVSGSTVHLTGSGTVVVRATQAANGSYLAATKDAMFTVAAAVPTIVFSIANKTYGDADFNVSATSNSGGAITYSVQSGPATASGSVVHLTGSGTVTIRATQAANGNYAASTKDATFTVAGQTPTINFSIGNKTFGDADFAVSATSDSPGAITYSILSGSVTISGSTVHLNGVGTVVVRASQVASGSFTAGTKDASFTVAAQTPTIAFTPIADKLTTDAPFSVSASSNAPAALTYSVQSGPATISGTTVTLTGAAGTVTLKAEQAAQGNSAAGSATTLFQVNTPGAPTISFAVPNKTFGDFDFSVNATSNSTGSITYSIQSGPATIAGSTIHLTGSGTVIVRASQAAAGTYSAGIKDVSFTVATATPSLLFVLANKTYGDADFNISATSNSAGAITYTVLSGPATLSGTTVHITGAGAVTVRASQAANGSYGAATKDATFSVAAATPTINFTVADHTFGDVPFAVSATSNSAGALTYSVLSGPATVNGNVVTISNSGTVVLQASQAAAGNYASTTKNASFIVNATVTTDIAFSIPNHTYGDAPFAVAASSNSTGALSYQLISGPATLSGNMVTLSGVGTVVVQVTQAASSPYPAATKQASFSVVKAVPAITWPTPSSINYGDALTSSRLNATSSVGGTFTYTPAAGAVLDAGTRMLTVNFSPTDSANYAQASASVQIVVNKASLTVTAASASRVYGVANPGFTGSVTGAVNGDTFTATYSTAAGIQSDAGSYAIVPAVTGARSANYNINAVNGSLTIMKANTSSTLTVAPSVPAVGSPVTLTVQVTSATSGTPSGTVSFLDNGIVVGTSALVAGQAVVSTTFGPGQHNVTAAYSGDTNFNPSVASSGAAPVTVVPPDFTVGLSSASSVEIAQGETASFVLTLTPQNGAFYSSVQLSSSGLLPLYSAASFTQASAPAGSPAFSTTFSVKTSKAGLAANHGTNTGLFLAMLLLPLGLIRRTRRAMRIGGPFLVALLVVSAAMMAGLTGCGTGFAERDYPINITVSSGGVVHTQTVTVHIRATSQH